MSSALERVEDSPTYPVTIVEGVDGLNMLVTEPRRRRPPRQQHHTAPRGRRHLRRRQGRRDGRLHDSHASSR